MMDDNDGDWGDGDWGSDVTGDPQLDVFGYKSPRDRRNLTGFEAHPPNQDWLVKNRADRATRAAKRAAEAQARRAAKRNESSGERQSTKITDKPGADEAGPDVAQAVTRDEIAERSLTELQPGQHGAYFERREVRAWYAPWKKRYVWQQISAWANTTPPRSGTEVVTVGSTDELNGRVRTIGTVGETGAVVY